MQVVVNVNVDAVYMREGERGVTVSVSLHCLGRVIETVSKWQLQGTCWKRGKRKKKAENELVSIYVYVYPLLFCIGYNEYSSLSRELRLQRPSLFRSKRFIILPFSRYMMKTTIQNKVGIDCSTDTDSEKHCSFSCQLSSSNKHHPQ